MLLCMALLHCKSSRFKAALRVTYVAQTIVSELDDTQARSLDYLLAVNTLTGYLLLLCKKPQQAI